MSSQQEPRPPAKINFFTIVGYITAFVVVVAIVVNVTELFSFRKHARPTPATSSLVKQATSPAASQEQQERESYILRDPQRMGRNMLFRLLAYKERGMSLKSYSYSSSRTVNYLLVNTADNSAHWLWQKGMPLILDETTLYPQDKNTNAAGRDALGMLLTIVTADTNKDTYADATDKQTLLAIRPDGSMNAVLTGIDRIHSITQIDDARALVVFEKEGKTSSAFYSATTARLTAEKPLPELTLP